MELIDVWLLRREEERWGGRRVCYKKKLVGGSNCVFFMMFLSFTRVETKSVRADNVIDLISEKKRRPS